MNELACGAHGARRVLARAIRDPVLGIEMPYPTRTCFCRRRGIGQKPKEQLTLTYDFFEQVR